MGADGAGQAGKVLRKISLPGTLGEPVIADVRRKGQPSILVMVGGDKLYCIE